MWIALAIAGGFLLVIAVIFNTLIGRRNRVRSVFGTIDAMLKKRWDLLPNLVSAVQGYLAHERELFERIALARSRIAKPRLGTNESVVADNLVTEAVGRFFATVERYPELKASRHVLHLQRTLTELEEQISAARRAYNAAVNDYNNAVEMFPSSLVARMMRYAPMDFFAIPGEERGPRSVG
ncbi:MAG: LemA family protein [Planctomycetes bacterium]|nr:LemA family protein [Planctomycetota bacterium]